MREGLLVGGKYRMDAKLGAGGMGEVWRARNERTDREFAIKFLRAEGARDPNLLARFFQEARVSGKLRHPSILEIIDVGSAPELDDAPFLVMELLDGVSLDALIAALGRLEPRLAVEIVATVSRALALAHAGGIVHRDLKPANIYLHRPGTGALVPKILDFGISKIAAANPLDGAPGLTQTGTVLGSPLYMSPEQASSEKSIDARSDVHALGVVLWECLVGKPPFPADTYNNLVIAIVTGERPRLGTTVPGVSPSLEAAVSRAFARKREDRFAGAAELADALDAELAKLGGPRLDARTAAAELFAAMQAAKAARPQPAPPPSAPPQSAPAPRSTTGGVSVATPKSPAAYTLGQSPQQEVARSDVQRAEVERAQVESAETLPHAMARSGDTMQSREAVSARSERSPATRPATRARMRFLLALGGALPVVALLAVGLLTSSRKSASGPAAAAVPLEPAAAVASAPAMPAVAAQPAAAPPPASSAPSSLVAAESAPSASASASASATAAFAASPAAAARAATKPAGKAVAPAAAAPAAPVRATKPAAPAKPVQDDPNKLF
jgi:serine/threonine-protein kinase